MFKDQGGCAVLMRKGDNPCGNFPRRLFADSCDTTIQQGAESLFNRAVFEASLRCLLANCRAQFITLVVVPTAMEKLVRMKEILKKVCMDWRCKLTEFNGVVDHVHLLIEAHPAIDLSRMVGNLKKVSARKMRAEFSAHLKSFNWKPMFWNSAYAVVSVGSHANLETVMRYIQDQETPSA
jgi:putative transposase